MRRFFSSEQKKVIFLDMNRTLIDPDKGQEQAFLAVWREFTGRWDRTSALQPKDVYARFRRETKLPARAGGKEGPALEAVRLKALEEIARLMEVGFSSQMAKQFLLKMKELQEMNPVLYPGVRETLEQLSRHYRLAIISNGSRPRQEARLQRLSLDQLIPAGQLFTSQKGGMRKPSPAIFRHALQQMRITANEGVMVGNSWKTDIAGSAGVGMDAVWIHPTHDKKSSLRKIGSVKAVIIRRFEQLCDIM